MRTFLALLLSGLTGFAAHVQVQVQDFQAGAKGSTLINLQLLGTNINGNYFAVGWPIARMTSAMGSTTYSNCIAGTYTLSISNVPTRQYLAVTLSVPTNDALYQASALVSSAVTSFDLGQAGWWILRNNGVGTNSSLYGPRLQPASGTVGYVWTLTNATTGGAEWQASQGGGGGGGTMITVTTNGTEVGILTGGIGITTNGVAVGNL